VSENNTSKKKSGRASIAAMDYGLGSGLGATTSFGTSKTARNLLSGPLANTEAKIVQLDLITSNPDQPRTYFDQDKLEELSADIKERGILQPPIVREIAEGRYEIVAGERRCRAAKMAGLTEIPVIIKEFENEQAVKLASLAENLQRDDLDIEDEVRFLNILKKEMNLSLRKIAEKIHRSHLYVYRRTKIAEHPELIELYRNGHAGVEELLKVATLEDEEQRTKAIRALKSRGNEKPKPEQVATDNTDKIVEDDMPVTLRNRLKPLYRASNALGEFRPDNLPKKDREALSEALAELEEAITSLKQRFEI
jgi:ParB family chromosome partitioning protein